MNAGEIQHTKFLRESGLYNEAAQFLLKILKQNPSDKLAKLGYAQALVKEGLKENLISLLMRAEKVLFDLIKDDFSFGQAHDELIFLSHYLNHMGSISKYYHEKIMQYPGREIYQECLKKVSATAMLTIPKTGLGAKKKKSFIVGIIGYLYVMLACVGLVLSLSAPKLRKLLMPSVIFIVVFIGKGFYEYLKGSKKTQW